MSIVLTVDEIILRVIEVVSRNALYNPDKVSVLSHIKNDHGIDSLKIVNVLFDLEDEFGIVVDQNALVFENFTNVEKISLFVHEKLGKVG